MNKEALIELKKRLELEKRNKSEYVAAATWGFDFNNRYTIDELKSKCDEKGISDLIEGLFERLIYYYNDKEVRYDSIIISLVYELFYKECDFTEERNELLEEAVPAYDYVKIGVSYFYCTNEDSKSDDDRKEKLKYFDEEIFKDYDKNFIVSLSDLKKELYLRGFDISDIHSFYEIDESIKDGSSIISNLKLEFPKKTKRLKLNN